MQNTGNRTHIEYIFMLVAGFILMMPMTAQARPDYVNRVPTPYRCETCHLDPTNRNLRTGFGIDFGLARAVWATDEPEVGICHLDSDADGLTNGEELADPDCLWRVGDRRPAGPTTNPADPRDPDRCGDGVLQEGEVCDGDALGDASCVSEGFMEGMLGCRNDCNAVDPSNCVPFPEPDMAIEPDAGAPDMSLPPVEDAGEVADALPTDLGIMDASPGTDSGASSANDAEPTPGDDAQAQAPDADHGSIDMGEQDQEADQSSDGGCSATGAGADIWWVTLFGFLLLRRRRGYRSHR